MSLSGSITQLPEIARLWILVAVVGMPPFAAQALTIVGNLATDSDAVDVDVVGGLAYVAGGGGPDLRVIDISNPMSPVELSDLDDTPDFAQDLEVVGGLAYVAGGSSLRVIDVSDPAAPVELGAIDIPDFSEELFGPPQDVEVVGDLAYVAAGHSGLRVIDVSDPWAPFEVGFFAFEVAEGETPGWARDVELVGGVAYLADGGVPSRLRLIDISDPAAPVELGGLDTGGGSSNPANDVEVVNELAFVADGSWGLRVIDVSDSGVPLELGALDTPGGALDVEVVGGLAYVADASGLLVIDVSNPAAPVELGALDTPGLAQDVEVVGELAYVANGFGLLVIDLGPEFADTDGDGLVNSGDPCESFPNALPLQDSNGDRIPDECQCGDTEPTGPGTNNGLLQSADAFAIAGCVVNPGACALDIGLSDADNNGLLQSADAFAVATQVITGSATAFTLTCAHRPEGTPPP